MADNQRDASATLCRLPEPPRKVRLRRWSVLPDLWARAFFSIFFGAGALLVLIAALLSAGRYFWGVEVPGQIVDVQFEAAAGKRSTDRYRVNYRFRAGRDSIPGTTEIEVSQVPAMPFELKPGAPVAVRVLPWLPRYSSTPAAEEVPFWGLFLFLLFAAGFDAFACVVQYGLWRDVVRQWRLMKYGREAHERIGDLRTKTGSKGGCWLDITFSYPCGVATMKIPAYWHNGARRGDGGVCGFAPSILRGTPNPLVQIGDPITVLYDPARSSRAIVCDFSMFRS